MCIYIIFIFYFKLKLCKYFEKLNFLNTVNVYNPIKIKTFVYKPAHINYLFIAIENIPKMNRFLCLELTVKKKNLKSV